MPRFSTFPLPGLLAILAMGCGTPDDTSPDSTTTKVDCTQAVATAAPASSSATVGTAVTITGVGEGCEGDVSLSWNLSQMPAGSALDATDLDTSKDGQVSFTPDTTGSFVIELVATDGAGNTSNPSYAVVTVTSDNSKPIADCGGNQSSSEGQRVDFDGSASSDPEGAVLTYDWTLASHPACSALSYDDIFNGTSPTASVVSDCDGIYVIGLTVSDGQNYSDPAYCTLTVSSGNKLPVADAGDSTTLSPCTDTDYQLDGFGSYDPEGETLTFRWTLISAPGGSSATQSSFSDDAVANPIFTWDRPGAYTLQLEVYDGVQWSAPDIVVYTFQDGGLNSPPVANAGADQSITKTPDCTSTSYVWSCEDCDSDDVTLDGSASDDPVDGDTLSFFWSEVDTSELSIQSPFSAVTKVYSPTFASEYNTAITKTWTVDLQVSDCTDADHDEVTITYTCTGESS